MADTTAYGALAIGEYVPAARSENEVLPIVDALIAAEDAAGSTKSGTLVFPDKTNADKFLRNLRTAAHERGKSSRISSNETDKKGDVTIVFYLSDRITRNRKPVEEIADSE